ncbi:MAG TPA: hypothetical protein VFL45_08975 [Gammaproteobacteria bacterium]|nr:hypothetical protein [Gammaproteobacteria bacterium]HET7588199.1 hypothetical protein [Gammaproteobacteria bacterium]
MHPSITDLLKIRDAEPVAADVRVHVDSCDHCANQLRELAAVRERLRALPPAPAPDGVWERIEAAAAVPERRAPRRGWLALGTAAAMLLAAGGAWMATIGGVTTVPADRPALTETASTSAPSLAALQRQSSQLEATLDALRGRDAMMSARAAGTIANLEDGVASIDYRLNQAAARGMAPAQARQLWSQRVDLMRSLVTVRYVQALAPSM